ncbi:MAG: hypothetical protein R3E88_22250 [Myxococcota bacterium]|nr:hypothetical protein [Myxococcales bacterium]
MPIEVVFEPDAPVMWVRMEGAVADADLDRLATGLLSDERAAVCNAVYDLRACTDLGGLSSETVRRLARAPHCRDERVHAIRIAILAEGDLAFGIGRMFQTLASDRMPNVAVVRDVAAARAFAAEGVAPPGHEFGAASA